MKACIINRYGSVEEFKIAEIEKPTCKSSEVIVKVHTAAINPIDVKVRNGDFKVITGLKFPKVLGADFSGEIIETGDKVSEYKVGDKVFGSSKFPLEKGSFAEFLATKAKHITKVPDGVSLEEAGVLTGITITTETVLRRVGKIKSGASVLVNGCTGGVGHFAVQYAKLVGAEVTGVCGTGNVEFAKELGVDKIVDYKKEDILKSSERYDIIFDTFGSMSGKNLLKSKKLLKPKGNFIVIIPSRQVMIHGALNFLFSKKAQFISTMPSGKTLAEFKEFVAKKELIVNIDKSFPLDSIQEAFVYFQNESIRGKVRIAISE
jgi:NADPH:quinone reductase-like Zn-dependent oxidoreductase